MLRRLLIIFVLVLGAGAAEASHLIGGDITWECLGNGQYKFYLRLYRDCQSQVAITPPVITVWNHPTLTTINVDLVSQIDISPNCNVSFGGQAISCSSPSPGAGAVEEFTYESAPITISGIPPPEGWVFSYDNCCRSSSILNLYTAQNYGFTFRAKMFSYNGMDADPCFDSSPQFAEKPATILCAGNRYTYNHNAIDPNLDSLTYSWAPALNLIDALPYDESIPYPAPLDYVTGYSFDNPMPGPQSNPNNVPATLDPLNGQITFTSYTQGYFVIVVRVTSWRCGQVISEVYREMQAIVLGNCQSNNLPVVSPPFPNGTFSDTVVAGDLVTFTLSGTDSDSYPDGSAQNVSIKASGSQFGANFTSTTSGCLNPPCATLNPAPPASGPGLTSTNFSWQTDCKHIAITDDCARTTSSYNFVIQVSDDFCPAPALTTATITIVVLALPTVGPPSLRCANTLPNGNVQLTWIPAVDTVGTFNNYQIYYSNSLGGPYIAIDSISNINATTYTHTAANGNSQTNYYYVRTKSGCLGQVLTTPTDTISNILLNLNNPGNGFAELSWNALGVPLPSTSGGIYYVHREYPAGTWVLIDSTTNLSYTDEIVFCDAQINYKVEIRDASGCSSFSNVKGDVFADVTPPPPVVIDSVSVDHITGFATISWNLSPSPDVVKYVIYRDNDNNPLIWNALPDTIDHPGTFYTYTASIAVNRSEGYRVAALDSCENVGLQGTPSYTIYLDTLFDACASTVRLSWNKYQVWGSGVDHYDIYASEDGSTPSLIGTVAAADTVFLHTNINEYVTYCYYVQAVDGTQTKTSSSNVQCIFTAIPKKPAFSYINVVTVPLLGGVDLYCYVDTAADVDYYEIYRSSDSLTYTELDTVDFTYVPIIHYFDSIAQTDRLSYWYKVVAVDTCGLRVDTTAHSRTILLMAEGKTDRNNYLNWNEYQGWLGNVQSYNVYRSIDGVFDPVPLTNLSNGTLSYIDNVADIIIGDGKFCYYIEGLEDAGDSLGFQEQSTSNVACAYQLPNFFVPNAFVPEGLNNVFIPVTVYVSRKNYTFIVYNRWGQRIFETHNILEGWDGKFEGELVQQGAYVYYFEYESSLGDKYEKRGTVTLLR